ncbi:MAG: hypothetical protein ACO3QA_09565 [Phycisphaerales bacterium]
MPPRNRDPRWILVVLAGGASVLLAPACTRSIENESSRFALEGIPPQLPPLIAPEVLSDRATRAGIDAALTPLGFVKSDGVSPPTLSPDGRHLAVQLAPAPNWVDLVAWRPEMPRPAPAIALVPVDPDGGLGTPVVPREPLLLGRSSTNDGVLVERPDGDGTRRIGMAFWDSGDVEWLVEDDGVAAMAVLGPDGDLAWCRSGAVGEPASLRLLRRNGELREWPPLPESTWMLPAFAGDGRRLFAMLLEDGRARLAAFDLRDPDEAVETWTFSSRVDAPMALRAILATGPDASPPGASSWSILHPDWNALCRWHPADGRLDRLPEGTYALTGPVGDGRLLADASGLWHVGSSSGDDEPRLDLLFDGVWIPRVFETSDGGAAAMLFRPDPTGFQVVRLSIDRLDAYPDAESGASNTGPPPR